MTRPSEARWFVLLFTGLLLAFGSADAQQTSQNPAPTGTAGANQGPRGLTSYMPVDITESFSSIFARLSALGIEVLSMRNKVNRLEEVFMRLVEGRSGSGEGTRADNTLPRAGSGPLPTPVEVAR